MQPPTILSVVLSIALPILALSPSNTTSSPGLGTLAHSAGLLYFGTAIDNVVLNNTHYTTLAFNRSEFSQATPANGQKWMYIEPSRNVFNYTLGDQITVPARSAGQLLRCHNFVWHSQLPDWLSRGNFTARELLGILETHIKHEAQHYARDCYAWDVVNEAFNDDGTLRESIWLRTLGKSYIEHAFRLARKYTAPGTRLYYNDYGIERVNNKSLAVQSFVKELLARDVPVDGVGLQAHFTVGRAPTYDDVRAAQGLFAGLGLETALTELDVRVALPVNGSAEQVQAEVYANATRACVDEESCVGITVWDFWDPVSWVPSSFPGFGSATLFREGFERKPAYWAVVDVLRAAAGLNGDGEEE